MIPLAAVLFLLAPPDPCRAAGAAGWTVVRHGPEEISYLREGRTMLVALRNTGGRATHVDVIWREIGFSGTARVFDLTANRDEGAVEGGFAKKLAPGACHAYRLTLPK
jgi:hypothetical protein